MTQLEALRAKLKASLNMKRVLDSTARSADSVADSLGETASTGAALSSVLDSAEGESAGLARMLGRANTELGKGAAQGALYAEGMDEAAQEQAEAAASAAFLEQRIDSTGDEFLQAALKGETFGQSLDGIEAGSLGANLGGLSGSLAQVGAVAAAATPALLGLGSALGGVGVGGVALGGGVLGLTAAGIQGRAESMAAFSSELETAADAREQLMSGFKSQLEEATEPLQNQQAQAFATANLAAAVDVAENASDSLRNLQATIIGVGSAFRETVVATSDDTFAALSTEVERLSPLLLDLRGAISDTPDLIRFLGSSAARIGPQLFNFVAAIMPAIVGVTELGLAVGDTLLPVLNPLLFTVAQLVGAFALLPDPIQNGIVAFGALVGAAALASTAMGAFTATTFGATLATQGLIAAIGTLTFPISATTAAIFALIAGGVALASHFGLLDAIFGAVAARFNLMVELVEFAVNGFIALAQTAADVAGPFLFLAGPIGALLFLIGNFNEIMTATTDVIDAVVSKIKELARIAGKVFGPVLAAVDKVATAVDEQGGVSLDGAKVGSGDDDPRKKPPSPPTSPPAPAGAGGGGRRSQRARGAGGGGSGATYDFSGADFSGSDPTRTKEQIKQAVQDANRESRNAEEGRVE